ncbi:7437_t:CDS:1, partial [Funneliformis mosseae]
CLKNIFQLSRNQSYYYVICKEHSIGKTTLTRKALREVGQEIIYVEIPANIENIKKFSIAFEESLNLAFEKCISFTA